MKYIKSLFQLIIILISLSGVNAYTNKIVCAGDSITDGTGYSNFCSQLSIYTGLTEIEKGISGGCLTAEGTCSTKSPLINRYQTDIINENGKYVILHSIINDNGNNVNLNTYNSNYDTILNQIQTQTPTSTIILTGMPNSNYAVGLYQERFAQMNAITRDLAIKYEIPYLELHYIENHDITSYTTDGTHYNQAGHNLVTEEIKKIIQNPNNYIMTSNNWNFYYECNIPLEVNEMTINSPSNNCISSGNTQEWIILKDITSNSFNLQRADNEFYLSVNNKLNPNTQYKLYYNNVFQRNIITNSSGGFTNELITAGSKTVTFNTNYTPTPQQDIITIKVNINIQNNKSIINKFNLNYINDTYSLNNYFKLNFNNLAWRK